MIPSRIDRLRASIVRQLRDLADRCNRTAASIEASPEKPPESWASGILTDAVNLVRDAVYLTAIMEQS